MWERIGKGIPAEDGRERRAIEIQPSVSTEHTKQKGLCRTKWTPGEGDTQRLNLVVHSRGTVLGSSQAQRVGGQMHS